MDWRGLAGSFRGETRVARRRERGAGEVEEGEGPGGVLVGARNSGGGARGVAGGARVEGTGRFAKLRAGPFDRLRAGPFNRRSPASFDQLRAGSSAGLWRVAAVCRCAI